MAAILHRAIAAVLVIALAGCSALACMAYQKPAVSHCHSSQPGNEMSEPKCCLDSDQAVSAHWAALEPAPDGLAATALTPHGFRQTLTAPSPNLVSSSPPTLRC